MSMRSLRYLTSTNESLTLGLVISLVRDASSPLLPSSKWG